MWFAAIEMKAKPTTFMESSPSEVPRKLPLLKAGDVQPRDVSNTQTNHKRLHPSLYHCKLVLELVPFIYTVPFPFVML